MAEYYTQFCSEINRLTQEERAWLTEQLNRCLGSDSPDNQDGDERVAQQDVKEFDDEDDEQVDSDEDEEDESGDFEWQLDGDSLRFWTMTGTGERLEVIQSLVQEFLQKFRPQESWWMVFALTCSRPVLNQITGGALFVTPQGHEYMDGFKWVGEMRRRQEQPG